MILTQSGDHRAFSHLYDRFAPRLNAFFYKMLWSDSELAEDHVHDLFTKIVDRPDLFKEGNLVKAWLFQIASNMCKNTYRKRQFETVYLEHLKSQGLQITTMDSKLDEELQMNLITSALKLLSEDDRSLFLLRYQQEIGIQELANIFEIPEGTVKSRLFALRKHLANSIKDEIKPVSHGK
ncbi:RNA polymerase sigma factor [Marinoscillum sp.]|uniref:RNA polymerase sigma factor n=1 Tax=Marinoscillum sp. TaxID=2024838 RepID=UPI003BAA3AE0